MERKNFKFKLIVWGILLLLGWRVPALAHDPPYAGKTDCGIIQSGIFYSNYYGPPTGTPASSGSCSWVKQSNTSCGIENYGGVNYTLYPYKWVCSLPLDSNVYFLLIAVIGFGYYQLSKKKVRENIVV